MRQSNTKSLAADVKSISGALGARISFAPVAIRDLAGNSILI
jgi:hypothetical protein